MTPVKKLLHRLFRIIALDQAYIEFAAPLITLIFFDASSRLLPPDTSYATRSMWYGACISLPYFINLFFAPLISSLSDEFGRRKFLLFEVGSGCLYLTLCAVGVLFGIFPLLIAGLVIRGAFSRTNTTALAIIGDVTSPAAKATYMSYMQVAIGVGACMGPILSGLLAHRFFFDFFNFSFPFFVAALLALFNVVMIYFYVPETLQIKSSQNWEASNRWTANLKSIHYVMTHPAVLKISLLLLLIQISWSTYYQFMGPLLKNVFHFSSDSLGTFIGMTAFWLIIGSGPLFNLLKKRYNQHQILNMGACGVITGILMAQAVYFHFLPEFCLWLSAIPIAIGDVITYICITTLYSNSVATHMQGKVMGVNFLVVGLIWGGTGLIGGYLITFSPILPLLLAPAGITGALLILNSNSGKELVESYNTY